MMKLRLRKINPRLFLAAHVALVLHYKRVAGLAVFRAHFEALEVVELLATPPTCLTGFTSSNILLLQFPSRIAKDSMT